MRAPKKPTVLKILEGNPGKKALPTNEPMPSKSEKIPDPPDHLDDNAKKEWRIVSEKLYNLGLLTEVDNTALALYCQAYGRWVDAELFIQLLGSTTQNANGNMVISPHVRIAEQAMAACHRYLSSFGMSPGSRASVSSIKKSEKSKFTGLISRGKKVL